MNLYIHGRNEPAGPRGNHVYINTMYSEKNESIHKSEFLSAYKKTVCELSATHPVFILNPIPEMGFNIHDANKLSEKLKTENVTIEKSVHLNRSEFSLQMNEIVKRECSANILDPLPFICDEKQCFAKKNGELLYYDDDHLNLNGAKKLEPLFERIFINN